MTLNGSHIGAALQQSSSTLANLSAACQSILELRLAPSTDRWYAQLHADLQQVQALAKEWREEYSTKLRSAVLSAVVHCGQGFTAARAEVADLFAQAERDPVGAKRELGARLADLRSRSELIVTAASEYQSALKGWGRRLQGAHDQLAGTVRKIQDETTGLEAEISSINATLAALQQQVIQVRQEIAKVRAGRQKGIVETIFDFVRAPFAPDPSVYLIGIGVISFSEAEAKVASMEGLLAAYQVRIAEAQQSLTADQAQVATLHALTLSGGVALSDSATAAQLLDSVRTSWEAFHQELDGVISKIGKAESAGALQVEQAWWGAACKEWELIEAGARGLMGPLLRAVPIRHVRIALQVG